MSRIAQLWRTSTVRLTGLFVLVFVIFSIFLLGAITIQSYIGIQRQQGADIDREVMLLVRTDQNQGIRGIWEAVSRLSNQPGPGIYYLGDGAGIMIAGNATDIPTDILTGEGTFSFNYTRSRPFDVSAPGERDAAQGFAVVRSVTLPSGLRLVVGRDVVERRGFTALIFQSFLWAVIGILVFSILAGGLTAVRVLNRIGTITATSSKIMSGNLSERVPVTRRNDEFDGLATNLNAMLDRIEQLLMGLKEVTDNVAHDLKTPLTRLRNRAEAALREGQGEEARREALESTIAESDQLIRTFNALLMIARAEAGSPSGAFSEIDLTAVVEDVADLYGVVAEEAGLTLEARAMPGLKLNANRELLSQALVNLIENAVKYGKPEAGEGRIVLSAIAAGNRIVIEVADNGPGIPDEDRSRVTERFVRLEKSRTEPGSGLGLALVKAVVQLHGGTLSLADNAPGLKAVIDLPMA